MARPLRRVPGLRRVIAKSRVRAGQLPKEDETDASSSTMRCWLVETMAPLFDATATSFHFRAGMAVMAAIVLAAPVARSSYAASHATRLTSQISAVQANGIPSDEDCSCPDPAPARKAGEPVDPRFASALTELYNKMSAGDRFSREEVSVLKRFHDGSPVDDIEAEVVASRALFDHYVEHRRLNGHQRHLFDRYLAYMSEADREPADLKGNCVTESATAECEPNDVASQATVAVHPYFTGEFSYTDDVDYFSFTVGRSCTVSIMFDADPVQSGNKVSSQVELLDVHQTVLSTSQGLTRVVPCTVPSAGTYYLRVSPDPAMGSQVGASGSYSLGVSQACAIGQVGRDDPKFKRVHPFEQGQPCKSGPMRNFEAFEFNVAESGPIVASLCPSGGGAADFDSFLVVYQAADGSRVDPFGADGCTDAVAANNDYCGLQSQVTADVAAGFFYVVVTGRCGSSLGSFTLNVTRNGEALGCSRVTPPPGEPEEEEFTVEMTATPEPVQTNGLVTFTIVLANAGCPRQQVVATDVLPPETAFVSCTTSAGTYAVSGNTVTVTIGRLDATNVVTVTIVARTACAMSTGARFSNTVVVTGKGGGGGHEEEAPMFRIMDTVECSVTNPPPVITIPAPMTKVANALQGYSVGAYVAFPMPAVADNCPGPVDVTCAPASGSFFGQGETSVTITATDSAGAVSTGTFRVTVLSPFGVCCVDDYSHDTFSQVVDRTSPIYGFWTYRVAATGTTMGGMADSLAYVPGRSLTSYDRNDPLWTMNANISFASRTGTVKVVERATGVSHVLRDRNTGDTPACQ